MAVILILIGGIGGYLTKHYMDNSQPFQLTNSKGDKKEVPLTASRNTATVNVVKQVGPAVVGITTKVYDKDIFNREVQIGEGVGSGVIIDAKGYIVTNNHVIANATNNIVTVSLADGSTAEGKVIGTDVATDLAVVKISTDKALTVAELGDSDNLQVGEPAIAIGNPLGLEFQGSVTTGVISAIHRTIEGSDQLIPLIQTDAAINPGNSGGALVNADGQVIGINSAKIAKAGVEGIGFAIPINEAKSVIEQLINTGKVQRPYIGVYVIDKRTAAEHGYQLNVDGLYIAKISAQGPAGKGGLQQGDVITKLNNTTVNSIAALRKELNTHKIGDTITITFTREGKSKTAEIVLTVASDKD